jgi:hypothetical protein
MPRGDAALIVLTSTSAGATKAAEVPGWTTYGRRVRATLFTDGESEAVRGPSAGSNTAWSPDTD